MPKSPAEKEIASSLRNYPYYLGARVRATRTLYQTYEGRVVAWRGDLGTVESLDTGPIEGHLPAVQFDRTRECVLVLYDEIEWLPGQSTMRF